MIVALWVVVLGLAWVGAEGKDALCYDSHPDLDGLLCYPACRSGYGGAGPVCWAHCPSGTTDIGAVCTKTSYGRGAGVPVSSCNSGYEKDGALCYPNCRSGYTGVGPVCWQSCNSGYTDDGALCRRDAHIYTRDTSSCPWTDACGLCGGPWYDVCGERRNCGEDCRSGYHDDGCTCRRDVHIYAKDSYGRGAGVPLSCRSDEELDGALCYDECRSSYDGVGPVCWSICSGDTTDTGTQCQKDSYGRGAGKPINCFASPPSCSTVDTGGCATATLELSKYVDYPSLSTQSCEALYELLKPTILILQGYTSCSTGSWSTVSLSYTTGFAVGYAVGAEVGVAIDVNTNQGICFVGSCQGGKSDVSAGMELNFGYWQSLDSIPGDSIGIEAGLDVPGTEIGAGATFVTSTDMNTYLGTVFSVGVGVGLSPIDLGMYSCSTPASGVTHFSVADRKK